MKLAMPLKLFFIICGFIFIINLNACIDEETTAENQLQNIDLWVTKAPMPVAFKSEIALGYELHLGDYEQLGYSISKVEIIDNDSTGTILKTYEGDELSNSLQAYNKEKPSQGAVIFVWPTFETSADVPLTLYHKVYFDNEGATITKEGAQTTVDTTETALISPPVTGDRWWAANGPSNFDLHHRRAIIDFQDVPYISQRFGVDLLQFDEDGYIYQNDGTANEDYYSYGAPLLAVADGTVINIKDDFPEQLPNQDMPYPLTVENVAGNFIILDLGNDRFAFYAHIIPETIQVSIGDTVSTGDVLAYLGNSGNSTAPHLHFQISDSSSFLISEGLPYVFDSYEYVGTLDNFEEIFETGGPLEMSGNSETVSNKFYNLNEIMNY
ncbi:MAG: M23 family metallopeptidase [Pseudomonadota bacterium]